MQDLETSSFAFSDLCQIVGMSKTLAQNWTSGRPFKIFPSIATAEGRGGRNIYSIYDAYLFAYLCRARKEGYGSDFLDRVVSLLTLRTASEPDPLKKYFGRSEPWLVISVVKYATGTHNTHRTEDGRQRFTDPLYLSDSHDETATMFAVNLEKLREVVNMRALKLLGKRNKRTKR